MWRRSTRVVEEARERVQSLELRACVVTCVVCDTARGSTRVLRRSFAGSRAVYIVCVAARPSEAPCTGSAGLTRVPHHAISEMLRLADDPDWRQATHSYAAGVPWGLITGCRVILHSSAGSSSTVIRQASEGIRATAGERSGAPYVEHEDEIRLGSMIKLEPEEAIWRFGSKLSVASLGAVPKPDKTVRVVFQVKKGGYG